ncbi:phosphoenolpyruvate carboxykinase (ATP), partial [Bacillus sp. WP8]|uniref:phosphoenolpyruvate carboxykinase (ATP) n=1 Tax=Bacillus sp. WP8 TaxID=756828 RepID=UPI0011A24AEB
FTPNQTLLTSTPPLPPTTRPYTPPSPKHKFILKQQTSQHKIHSAQLNHPISKQPFHPLYTNLLSYLKQPHQLFLFQPFLLSPSQHLSTSSYYFEPSMRSFCRSLLAHYFLRLITNT